MSDQIWRAEEMGSEGWSVFAKTGNERRARYFERMIASNLTEEDAKLIANAPSTEHRVERLKEYAQHMPDCELPTQGVRGICNCGFTQTLAEEGDK